MKEQEVALELLLLVVGVALAPVVVHAHLVVVALVPAEDKHLAAILCQVPVLLALELVLDILE